MNFKLSTLAAAAALLVNCSAPVMAEEKILLATIGHWKIKSTPGFLCDASGEFRDGTLLEFSINFKGAAIITVQDPKWHIPDDQYQVVTQVDRAPAETVTAHGNRNYVMWSIPLDQESINLLSYGRTLRITLGQTVLSYDLALSEAAWKALGKCAAPMLEAANPFAGQPPATTSKTPPATTESPANPFRRL